MESNSGFAAGRNILTEKTTVCTLHYSALVSGNFI
jgi:hypothetical protein